MIKLSTVLAGLALGALAVPVLAQDYIYVGQPQYAGKYDVSTNTFYPSSIDPDTVASPGDADPQILYDNSATNGYFTTGAGAIVTNHYTDWGVANFGGSGATIEEFRIAYVSNAPTDTAALRIRLYQGTTGFGVQGTVIFDQVFTGLPSGNGAYAGFLVDVTGLTLSMADGPIGWSYNSDNVGTQTGPFLVGPPNGPGVENAYDRYLESTEAYGGTFQFTGIMSSFCIRLTGRATGAPPSPWQDYGEKNGTTLSGTGSATPGSIDNVITIKNSPSGKSVIMVIGVTQSDFFQPALGLHFYAFPWLLQLAPMVTDPFSGQIALPAPLPGDVPVGTKIYMQAFGQNLANEYKKWSNGLELTIQ